VAESQIIVEAGQSLELGLINHKKTASSRESGDPGGSATGKSERILFVRSNGKALWILDLRDASAFATLPRDKSHRLLALRSPKGVEGSRMTPFFLFC
jgi:hypothetical protein